MKFSTKVKRESIIQLFLIILIPIIIFGLSFRLIVFDEHFYKKEFSKYNVYEGLKGHDIDKVNSDLLSYLRSEKGNVLIKSNFFNQKEKEHLLDVKNLIQAAILVFYISVVSFILIFVLFKKKFFNRIIKSMFFGAVLTLIIVLIFKVLLMNFSVSFTKFHLLFFSNDKWLLNPATDKLVVLYPEGFFLDISSKIGLNAMIYANILILVYILWFIIPYFSRKG